MQDDISAGAQQILEHLKICTGPDGLCWLTLTEIAADLNISRTTVNYHVKDLMERDYVKRSRKPEGFVYRVVKND